MRNKQIVMAITLPATAALLLLVILPENGLSTPAQFTDTFKPKGHIDVSVHRDGKLIYQTSNNNLITNAGRDFISLQVGALSGLGTNGANYIALTTDATAPAVTDTTLAGEITTGGLGRSQGTYSHTTGTDNWSITKQFNATASFTGVQKAGLFNAGAAGTMMAESTFSSVNLASGDTLTITWTIDLGLA